MNWRAACCCVGVRDGEDDRGEKERVGKIRDDYAFGTEFKESFHLHPWPRRIVDVVVVVPVCTM